MTIAYIFPGQGSQVVGMGLALTQNYPEARVTLEEADSVLGFPLRELCFHGPEQELTETYNAQPALLAVSVAIWRVLAERGAPPPAYVAGHSLGEISALVAAGALAYADALRLVRARGRLMREAGERHPGGMAAVLGGERAMLAEVCAEVSASTGTVLQIANDNAPGQVVLSGAHSALDAAAPLVKARGAKRFMPLNISIAAHSALMADAAAQFRAELDATPFSAPLVPIISNVTATPLAGDPESLRAELTAQLTSAVRWTESVQALAAAGVTHLIELGPKDVLTGLLKRIDPTLKGLAAGEIQGLIHAFQWINATAISV